MNKSELRKIAKEIEYETRRLELRKEFEEKGIRFSDKHGRGYIRDGVKHYD
jgi:hypothetical protein